MLTRLKRGDHFIVYKNTKPRCHTAEANVMLYVSCTPIKKRKEIEKNSSQNLFQNKILGK